MKNKEKSNKKNKENKNTKNQISKNLENLKRIKTEIPLTKGIKKIDISPISKKDPFKTITSKSNINETISKRKGKQKDDFSLKNIFHKNLKEKINSNFLENDIDIFKFPFSKNETFINDSILNSNYSNKSFLTVKSKSKFESLFKVKEENIDSLRNKLTPNFKYSFNNYLKQKLKKNKHL